jgi:deoxyribodipyrimidine photo-lyase
MKRLSGFCERRLRAYKEQRDTPSIDATSMLSPYLNAGVVSPRQCIVMARDANGGRYDDRAPGHAGGAHWISEVIWREFYQHVLVGFPRVCMHRAFRPATERLVWEQNPEHLQRWKEGRTGVPIVDAAMRQMNTMGWMHNRLRMVAAMYFTKDLFLDWRLGERYFMQTLVDGDLGSNNGGWQWSASTGTDAAPYFRIFNPASQSKRCDPDGEFIRRWVPELRDVEGEAIHEPGALPGLLRQRVEYPEPLVDHDVARERVLRAFKGLDDRAQREA